MKREVVTIISKFIPYHLHFQLYAELSLALWPHPNKKKIIEKSYQILISILVFRKCLN
jgi:hypothetical protein